MKGLRKALTGTAIMGAAAVWSGCGPDPGPTRWIAERSAVVQCTTAGPHRMPPVLGELPVPAVPRGLYAGGMDAISLDALGFMRDAVVCATLVPPPDDVRATLGPGVEALTRARAEAGRRAMQAGGRCTCAAAGALGQRDLIRSCVDTPTRQQCDPQASLSEVRAALTPLVEAMSTTAQPRIHWRVAGRTDRPGWFAKHQSEVIGAYEGGSKVYLRGEPVPARRNFELVRRLLDEDGVQAVVVQDSGLALVVVRELGRYLVIDRFAYPPVDARNAPMLAEWDNAWAEGIVAMLEAPAEQRTLGFVPGKGNLVEVDRAQLQAMDEVVAAMEPLSARLNDLPAVEGEAPKIERFTVQAPFGHEGDVLRVRAVLGEEGRQWASGLGDEPLSPTLEELGLREGPVADDEERGPNARMQDEDPWLYRATATQRQGFSGLEDLAWIFARIEMEHPGAIGGRGSKWSVKLPASDLTTIFGEELPLGGLRSQLAEKPYRIDVSFERDRQVLRLEVAPR